ncbi:MAG: glycoside hydrolase family 9 protein, partial [Bacteroidota bacterium]
MNPLIRKGLFLLICLCLSSISYAAELVEVLPLTNRLLMVHFDDGYVRHHQLGETRETEWVVGTPLNLSQATVLSSYQLSSPTDPNYSNGQVPQTLYRKSKPTDFTWLCQGWDGDCVNTDLDHAKEHWLYLELPHDLQTGTSYILSFPGVPGFTDYAFTFDELASRSEAIHVNQLGYVPDAGEKYGYVYHWLGDGGSLDGQGIIGANFHLVDETNGSSAFSGKVAFRKAVNNQEFFHIDQAPPNGNLVGTAVYECDFSSFQSPGTYRLCVEGMGCSFPFEIEANLYREPMTAVLHGLYQQRSGIATEAAFTSQPRPIPHHPTLTPGFTGKLQYSSFRYPDFSEGDGGTGDQSAIEAGIQGPLDLWGWYQDAGDWDGYYSHTAVPMHLLWLVEMGGNTFQDGDLALPENNNGLPDLLDEAMWLPRYYQRMRQELIDKGYGSGGVGGGRVFGDLWGGDVLADGTTIGSWQDTSRMWVCTGEDPFSSYMYAGMSAQLAFLLQERNLTDPAGIDWSVEAVAAYTWASQHTLPQDSVLFDQPITHPRLYAAANLYRLTGNPAYETTFIQDHQTIQTDVIAGPLLFGWATYVATEGEQSLNANVLQDVKDRIEAEADFILLDFRDERACRWGGNWYFPFLVGQPTTPMVQAGILGHHLFQDSKPAKAEQYRDALFSTADYFLGNNSLNQTWITGLGERSPADVFCLDSWYLGGDEPRYGIVPYGPWESATDYGSLGPWNHVWAFAFT